MESIMLETFLISALFSMVASLVLTYALTGGERNVLNLFMALYGLAIGWIYGMVWVFITGGLTYSLVTMVSGIVITCVFVVIAFAKMQDVISIVQPRNETVATIASIAAILVVVCMLFFTSMPSSYASSPNTIQMVPSVDRFEYQLEVNDDIEEAWLAGPTLTGSIVIISERLSAVDFPRLTTSPEEGDYLAVDIELKVTGGGNWEQPYVKLAITEDANNNGQPDSGELIWSSSNSKFAISSGTKWRSAVLWEGGSPKLQIITASSGGNPLFMPLFHASQITQWKNDVGKTFTNTPENYIPTVDQLSWEFSGTSLTPKEQISTFSTISVGQSSTLSGKIYCPTGSAGNHILMVTAFDLRFQTDPYDMTETPISQGILQFTIGGNGGGNGNGGGDPPIVDVTVGSWVVPAFIGVCVVGTGWYGRKYF